MSASTVVMMAYAISTFLEVRVFFFCWLCERARIFALGLRRHGPCETATTRGPLLHLAHVPAKSNGFKNSRAPCELTFPPTLPRGPHHIPFPSSLLRPAAPHDAPNPPRPLLPPLPTSAIPIPHPLPEPGGLGRRARCQPSPSPRPPCRRLRGLCVRLLPAPAPAPGPASVSPRRGAGAVAMGAGATSPRRPPRG
jgi:hypothetical protein